MKTILDKIRFFWSKGYVSVLKDEEDQYWCGNWQDSKDEAIKCFDLRKMIDGYRCFDAKIVDTIHVTQLCGGGSQKGDKYKVKKTGEVRTYNWMATIGGILKVGFDEDTEHYKLTEIEPYMPEGKETKNPITKEVIEKIEKNLEEGMKIYSATLQDIKKLKPIK